MDGLVTLSFSWPLAIAPGKLVLVASTLLLTLMLAMVLTPLAMRLAHRAGVLDHPHDARRVHSTPTPRWGGLAMCAAFILTVLLVMPLRAKFFPETLGHGGVIFNSRILGIVICGALMTALGALDDKFSLPAKVKLLAQVLIAILLTLFGVRMVVAFNIPLMDNQYYQLPLWREAIGYLFTVIWVVAVTNTINLIDGLDGLAAGVSGLAAATFVAIGILIKGTLGEAMLAAAVVGACLGFLRYNFHPARVFMGDAGSHFLGFTIAALAILQNWKVAAAITLAIPMLILAVPIFDTVFAIIRRLRRGQPIFSADKGHLHHRLLNMGFGQRKVVLSIYLITLLGCLLALLLAHARLRPYLVPLAPKLPAAQQQPRTGT